MGVKEVHISKRIKELRLRSAQKYNIFPEKCHIGHLVLQGMLEQPDMLNQIDAATGTSETNLSVATRSMRLASAMSNYGLQPGDAVVVMGPNHLDIAVPYYACHFHGFSMCGMDPNITLADLKELFPYINPKMVFCQTNNVKHVKEAFIRNNQEGKIVIFDDESDNLENFIKAYNGTEIGFRPNEFNQSKIAAWLMLTSGTTGLPKVAIIPYDTVLNGIRCWWTPFTDPLELTLTMSTFQWLSSLVLFISGPLRLYTRLQMSVPLTPQLLIVTINKYKPHVTAWTPYLLGQFLHGTEKICDLTCFKYILISGSTVEKPLLDLMKSRTNAFLYLVYGMTELLVPGFNYTRSTPLGSVGKPFEYNEYRLVDDNGFNIEKPFKSGELWIKGNSFFKGYLNNLEETRKMLTEDGWLKTGDIFYKDNDNNYYFVERKRLLIKSAGHFISPLQLENIIKKHPAVAEVCVVGIPDEFLTEVPVAAIVKKNGQQINPQEIFNLIKEELPDTRQLHGGFFYAPGIPVTASGKMHRVKVKEMAFGAHRILINDLNES
ncbi:luciferin 4-monooxygenase-like [Achroia grisella]|uniref:luciferin 4-monooxygenase-like n=1 Tax=Achroia grisella TaxID=688607 RepID=UPI0027D20DE3|nr:luciferin 4-monooxygenase-like [Achroia grisella]